MYQFHIITVSKNPSGPWQELVQDYLKRLRIFARCEVKVVKQVQFRSAAQRAQVQQAEAEAIRQALPKHATIVACDERGKEYTSRAFSHQIGDWSMQQTQPVVFLIGGPLGLDAELLAQAQAKLAFSQLTFPHDLAQVVLVEQLYRACTIQTGKIYHY